MDRRFVFGQLALAALASLGAFCFRSPAAPWLAAFACATFPVALIALGASRQGRLGSLGPPLQALWVLLAGGLAAILLLPGGGPDVAGLPAATALMIFVLIPVPLIGLGLLYAFSFDRHGPREEDLERMRQMRRLSQAREGES